MKFIKVAENRWQNQHDDCPYEIDDAEKHYIELALKYTIEDSPIGGTYDGDIHWVNKFLEKRRRENTPLYGTFC